jgi:hypothetical protein
MKEVEKLLIKEAEKYVGNRASKIDSMHYGNGYDPSKFTIKSVEYNKGCGEVIANYSRCDSFTLFDPKSGKWAEIIEEKKPLYTNSHGTEFFDGDEHYYVSLDDFEIVKNKLWTEDYKQNHLVTEAMTERECHQWIADNWDELKK